MTIDLGREAENLVEKDGEQESEWRRCQMEAEKRRSSNFSEGHS